MGSGQRGTLDAYVETSPGHCQRRRAGPRSIPAGWAPHRDHQLRRCPTQLLDKPTSGPHKAGGQSPLLTCRPGGWWRRGQGVP